MKTIPTHTLTFIDSWLKLRAKWESYPGFVVAIAKDGKVIFNHAYGLADIEKKQVMTTHHLFRIASHSKTFTATALMQLKEAGRLNLDDPVVSHLPWLKKHKDARWQYVTLRQLMSHSAGVIRDGVDADYWQLKGDFPDAKKLREEILKADLVFDTNTKLKYSNFGYSLLGMVVESVSKHTYDEYVREHIIAPLGLTHTTTEYSSLQKNAVTGYSRENIDRQRTAFPHVTTGAMAAATGFCSTAEDLCAYCSAHVVGTGKLLSDESKREMQHGWWQAKGFRSNESYGLGLDVVQHKNRSLIAHSGGFPGFITRSYVDSADKIAVVVLTNAHGTAPNLMAKAIFDILDEFGDEPPKAALKKYEGRFVSLHGAVEVIAHAGGLRSIYPNSWYPIDTVDKLEVVGDDTLKIVDAGSFDNEGELIHYDRDSNGAVKSIRHSGSYMPVSQDGDLIKTW